MPQYTFQEYERMVGNHPLWAAINQLLDRAKENNEFSAKNIQLAALTGDIQLFQALTEHLFLINDISDSMGELEHKHILFFGYPYMRDNQQIYLLDALLGSIEKALGLLPPETKEPLEKQTRLLRAEISTAQKQTDYIVYVSSLSEKNVNNPVQKENLQPVSEVKGRMFFGKSEEPASKLQNSAFSVDYTGSIDCDL
ncbi:MAG: hypothetical protein HKM04_04040 [Legionellales bacterium]|nr:hypothetical protein [Legionellales bacterium]